MQLSRDPPAALAPGFCIKRQRGSPGTDKSTAATEHAKHLGYRVVPMETEGAQGAYRGPRPVCTLRHKPKPGFHHSPQCHQQILGPSPQEP